MNKASNIITIKGQPAAVTFEADINAFRGKFLNVNGYCDFVATSIEALYREGESALDEWMADCEEDGIAPFREEEEQKTPDASCSSSHRFTADHCRQTTFHFKKSAYC